MPSSAIPIAAHFLTGSIISLAIPLGLLIVVAVWYGIRWRRDAAER